MKPYKVIKYPLSWGYRRSSVSQFSHSVVSNCLWPHELQHARPPCPSKTPRVHSNSCLSSQWCHPAISSSVVPFSSCPQSLPASESLPMSQLFAWGGQSIGVWALASFLPKNTQGWSPLEWTGWISLKSKGLSSLLQHHSSKASIFRHSAFFTVQLSHPYMTDELYFYLLYFFLSLQMDPIQKAVINHTFGVPLPHRRKQIISCNICQLRFNSDVSLPFSIQWKNAVCCSNLAEEISEAFFSNDWACQNSKIAF